MATNRSRIKQGFVDIPEGQIHYRTAGDGPALLLIHNTSFSSDCFLDVMPILATRHKVIAMDRLGHGGSDPPPDDVTMEDLTKALVNFLDALGVDRTSIVGHLTGAYEGLELAIAYPQRVEKLVLVKLPDWTPEERAELVAEEERTLRSGVVPKMDGSHLLEEWTFVRGFAESPASSPEMVHTWVMASLKSKAAFWDVRLSVFRHDIRKRLPLLKVPTLLVDLEHEPEPHLELNKSLMPSSTPVETAIFEGVGNLAAMENPEQFARVIMDFLAKS